MSFKIYAPFESVLKRLQRDNNGSNATYTKKYQEHVSCSFAYKIVYIDDRFNKSVVFYRGKNPVHKFITAILNENRYCRLVIKIFL